MGFLKRILGICNTRPPQDPDSWQVEGRELILDLRRIPELQHPSGAIRLEGKDLAFRVLVVHTDAERFLAYENRCTHMGRRIDPVPGSNRVRCCSVSKSTFDYDGNPVAGAARKPIRVFETSKKDDTLRVDLAVSAGE